MIGRIWRPVRTLGCCAIPRSATLRAAHVRGYEHTVLPSLRLRDGDGADSIVLDERHLGRAHFSVPRQLVLPPATGFAAFASQFSRVNHVTMVAKRERKVNEDF